MDLTHVVDCSGAYIPGHGTPTVILFGRNRVPVASVVRTVRGIRGEPSAPDDPAHGMVWSAIVEQADLDRSESAFISTEDSSRATLNAHPWNMGGGGAAEVQEAIGEERPLLGSIAESIGITAFTLEDDLFLLDKRSAQKQISSPSPCELCFWVMIFATGARARTCVPSFPTMRNSGR